MLAQAAFALGRAAGLGAGPCEGQRLAQEAGEAGGAVEGEVEAVGLEPVGVALAVGDPVEQDAAFGVALGLGADDVGVVAGAATKLERGDQAEDAFGSDQVEGLLELVLGEGGVGAERDHDQVGEAVLALVVAHHVQPLVDLAAAAGVDLVALVGEVGEGEQHRRVADRERRVPAGVDLLRRLRALGAAAGLGGPGPEDEGCGGGGERSGGDLESAAHGNRSISITPLLRSEAAGKLTKAATCSSRPSSSRSSSRSC